MIHWNTGAGSEVSSLTSVVSEGSSLCIMFLAPGMVSTEEQCVSETFECPSGF